MGRETIESNSTIAVKDYQFFNPEKFDTDQW